MCRPASTLTHFYLDQIAALARRQQREPLQQGEAHAGLGCKQGAGRICVFPA